MNIKKVHIFYFSPTHTTKTVVENIGKGINLETHIYDFTFSCDSPKDYNFGKEDLVIVGVPVYGGRTPFITRKVLEKIKGSEALAVPVAVYGNRAYEDCLLELKNILKENGFICIAGGAFIGEHSYTKKVGTNRPDNIDIQKAQEFGKLIREKLENETYSHDIEVKGNFPYKADMPKMVFAPTPNENCVDCGSCASACPTGAIDIDNHRKINPEKCIRCYACVRACRFDGRELAGNPLAKILNFLETTCLERKEPEIFI